MDRRAVQSHLIAACCSAVAAPQRGSAAARPSASPVPSSAPRDAGPLDRLCRGHAEPEAGADKVSGSGG